MPQDPLPGPKFDHVHRPLLKVLVIIYSVVAVIGISLNIYLLLKHKGNMGGVVTLLFLPILMSGLRKRWQLAPNGIVDLRKPSEVMIPYADIQSVRLIKNSGKTGKVFEISTPEKANRIDVLQGDEFLADLTSHLSAASVTMS